MFTPDFIFNDRISFIMAFLELLITSLMDHNIILDPGYLDSQLYSIGAFSTIDTGYVDIGGCTLKHQHVGGVGQVKAHLHVQRVIEPHLLDTAEYPEAQ